MLDNIAKESRAAGPKTQNWEVRSVLDKTHWNATVDFRVKGKPSPPPVALLATIWVSSRANTDDEEAKDTIEFTDPSSTLAKPNIPLNTWVQLNEG